MLKHMPLYPLLKHGVLRAVQITARELAMWIFYKKENRIGQRCVYIV